MHGENRPENEEVREERGIMCDCGHTLTGHPGRKNCVMPAADEPHKRCPCKAFRPVMAQAAGREKEELELLPVQMAGWMLGRLWDNEGKGFVGRKVDDQIQWVSHRENLIHKAAMNFSAFQEAVLEGNIPMAKKHAADTANYLAMAVRFLEAHNELVAKFNQPSA